VVWFLFLLVRHFGCCIDELLFVFRRSFLAILVIFLHRDFSWAVWWGLYLVIRNLAWYTEVGPVVFRYGFFGWPFKVEVCWVYLGEIVGILVVVFFRFFLYCFFLMEFAGLIVWLSYFVDFLF